jgi:phage gp36-like protein
MYITLAQAKTALARIDNVYKVDGEIDEDFLQDVIDESEGMINSAISSRYDIPVTPTNAVAFLRALVLPILRFKTYTLFNESNSEEMPKMVVEEYKATLKILDDLAKQVISVPDGTEKTTGRASYIKINTVDSSISTF